MTVIHFSLRSALGPAEALAVLTDFGPTRPQKWPSIDADHFTVHELGDRWAEVTEGTASAWERARYEWNVEEGHVAVTTHDSKVFGPGGGWDFTVTPEGDGSRVDVRLTRTPATIGGKVLAALLPLVGPSSLRNSFSRLLQAA